MFIKGVLAAVFITQSIGTINAIDDAIQGRIAAQKYGTNVGTEIQAHFESNSETRKRLSEIGKYGYFVGIIVGREILYPNLPS